MGANNGTGYPLTLRCAKCRVGKRGDRESVGTDLCATGRTKPLRANECLGYRSTRRRIEICCQACGHVGWTKHSAAEALLARFLDRPRHDAWKS